MHNTHNTHNRNYIEHGEPINAGQRHVLSKNTWAHRVFIKSVTRGRDFRGISAISLARGIAQALTGLLLNIILLKNGAILAQPKSAETLRKILNMGKFALCNIQAVGYNPDTVVTCMGVIFNLPQSEESKNNEEELKNLETSAAIIKMDRIKNRQGMPTGAVQITFMGNVLPEYVRFIDSGIMLPVDPYQTPPLRCFQCQGFGHTSTHCNSHLKCARCAGRHKSRYCPTDIACCPNCKGAHTSRFRLCPVYLQASAIQEYKNSHGCSWAQAESIVIASQCRKSPSPPKLSTTKKIILNSDTRHSFHPRPTYSDVLKTPSPSSKSTQPIKQLIETKCRPEQVMAQGSNPKNANCLVSNLSQTQDSNPSSTSDISSCPLSTDESSSWTFSPNHSPLVNRSRSGALNSTPTNTLEFSREGPSLTDISTLESPLRESPPTPIPNPLTYLDKGTQTEFFQVAKDTQTSPLKINLEFRGEIRTFSLDQLSQVINEVAESRLKGNTINIQQINAKIIAAWAKKHALTTPKPTDSSHIRVVRQPARRVTPVAVPSSIINTVMSNSAPKTRETKLRCLNSPLKIRGGDRRHSVGSQAAGGVKKQFKF